MQPRYEETTKDGNSSTTGSSKPKSNKDQFTIEGTLNMPQYKPIRVIGHGAFGKSIPFFFSVCQFFFQATFLRHSA